MQVYCVKENVRLQKAQTFVDSYKKKNIKIDFKRLTSS